MFSTVVAGWYIVIASLLILNGVNVWIYAYNKKAIWEKVMYSVIAVLMVIIALDMVGKYAR